MKILIVSDVFPPRCGGVGWAAFHLAKALKRHAHDVEVVTCFGEADEFEGIKIHRTKTRFTKQFAHIALRKKVRELISSQKVDLINAHNAVAVRACQGLGVKMIASVHDYWPICFKGTRFLRYKKQRGETNTWSGVFKCLFFENNFIVKLFSLPITVFMKYRTYASLRALKKADAIAYNSKFVKEQISPLTKDIPSNIWVNLCATVDPKKVIAKRFTRSTVLFVGKFTIEKGAMIIPDIAKLVPQADFIMIGQFDEPPKGLPSNLEVIPYLQQDELFSYMKGADIFLAPALWDEPFGRIVVEAMAMGCACIVSDRGGMSSDIIIDGKDGFIVKDVSPRGFQRAINHLLKNPKKMDSLKKEAREAFLDRFSEKIAIEQFEELLNQIS